MFYKCYTQNVLHVQTFLPYYYSEINRTSKFIKFLIIFIPSLEHSKKFAVCATHKKNHWSSKVLKKNLSLNYYVQS